MENLIKQAGYEHYLMKLVGITEENSSIVKLTLWWKTENNNIHEEVR